MTSDYGMKISKPGQDVFTAPAKDLRFNSDSPVLKIFKIGDATFNTDGSVMDQWLFPII